MLFGDRPPVQLHGDARNVDFQSVAEGRVVGEPSQGAGQLGRIAGAHQEHVLAVAQVRQADPVTWTSLRVVTIGSPCAIAAARVPWRREAPSRKGRHTASHALR